MTQLSGEGISVELPSGWEGAIGRSTELPDGAQRNVVAHFASFPLPPRRGDFGGGAVDLMDAGDALVVLFDYGQSAVGSALFASEGVPSVIASDFDRDILQKSIPGQSGVQRFFTVAGRAICLYVVVGSHIDRAEVIPAVNQLLESVHIS
ncbi:MAG TPA: hypothetical protein VJ796_07785 [Acidimicrobiia bacterium]|jgi:hypothetical protein|nr:hypothetical protein [Acidimicrobiia bacterium]